VNKTSGSSVSSSSKTPIRNSVEKQISDPEQKVFRCNCMEVGHRATECPKPKRERGSCFNCGSISHKKSDWPGTKPTVVKGESSIALKDYDKFL
jgi:hypothetical protein